MTPWPEEFSAEGKYVRIEVLTQTHCEDLKEATLDGELSNLWYTFVPTPEDMEGEITRRRSLDNMMPFAIIDKASGKAVGMTTFMNIEPANRRLEIGSTWYAKSAQRGPTNTETKLLLLQHAFEVVDCIAVEFRTHFVNMASRRAIERLGAKADGVLRNHMIMPNGTLRDTAVYSIIAGEWPTVKTHLEFQLEKPRN